MIRSELFQVIWRLLLCLRMMLAFSGTGYEVGGVSDWQSGPTGEVKKSREIFFSRDKRYN